MSSTRRVRLAARWVHLVVGLALATYVYWSPGDDHPLRWGLMLVGLPAVVATGVVMWRPKPVRPVIDRLTGRRAVRTS